MSWRLIPPLLLLLVLGIFALQNTTVLSVGFLVWSFQISQALLIVLCGGIGLVMGFLLSVALRLKAKGKD